MLARFCAFSVANHKKNHAGNYLSLVLIINSIIKPHRSPIIITCVVLKQLQLNPCTQIVTVSNFVYIRYLICMKCTTDFNCKVEK